MISQICIYLILKEVIKKSRKMSMFFNHVFFCTPLPKVWANLSLACPARQNDEEYEVTD